MSIYIDQIIRNGWGSWVDAAIDILSKPFYSRRRPGRRIVITTELNLQYFERPRLTNLLVIFASRGNSIEFKNALRPVYTGISGDDFPVLLPIYFKLRENHDYLASRFPGMAEFAADGIRDDFVKKARVRGITLEDSPQFQDWILDEERSGRLSSMGITVRNSVINVKPNGSMYSSGGRRPAVGAVVDIIEALLDCRGIVLRPDITSFTS